MCAKRVCTSLRRDNWQQPARRRQTAATRRPESYPAGPRAGLAMRPACRRTVGPPPGGTPIRGSRPPQREPALIAARRSAPTPSWRRRGLEPTCRAAAWARAFVDHRKGQRGRRCAGTPGAGRTRPRLQADPTHRSGLAGPAARRGRRAGCEAGLPDRDGRPDAARRAPAPNPRRRPPIAVPWRARGGGGAGAPAQGSRGAPLGRGSPPALPLCPRTSPPYYPPPHPIHRAGPRHRPLRTGHISHATVPDERDNGGAFGPLRGPAAAPGAPRPPGMPGPGLRADPLEGAPQDPEKMLRLAISVAPRDRAGSAKGFPSRLPSASFRGPARTAGRPT